MSVFFVKQQPILNGVCKLFRFIRLKVEGVFTGNLAENRNIAGDDGNLMLGCLDKRKPKTLPFRCANKTCTVFIN